MPDIQAESSSYSDPELPDFSVYVQVKDKKANFFEYMLPLIQSENQRLLTLREHLQVLVPLANSLNEDQREWLQQLATYYRAKDTSRPDEELIAELLLKVDLIPPSLALAQSANESAWGSSRFAVKGNNLFGQWCFNKGCGMLPSGRDPGASHEVASYSSPRQSVESYIHNLNTNQAYAQLRQLRASSRQQTKTISGPKLAQGLLKYSSRGEDYVSELQQMIRINKLDQYDAL
ncbi:MAG: glucosaminidase domain-containing protein [Oceanicoccus sp.]